MRILVLALLVGAITGCAAIPSIANIFFGKATETFPPEQLYRYRAELEVTVDNVKFQGVAVTKQHPVVVRVESKFGFDRIQFTSCGRHFVARDLDCGWFCKTKTYDYQYTPTDVENQGMCPLYIEVFSKKALAAWGMVAFRFDESLPAVMGCNGVARPFGGYSMCQTKAGLDQTLRFEVPIEKFRADPLCNMKKVNSKEFVMRPGLGMCIGTFRANKQWHQLNLLGYERVLVEGE